MWISFSQKFSFFFCFISFLFSLFSFSFFFIHCVLSTLISEMSLLIWEQKENVLLIWLEHVCLLKVVICFVFCQFLTNYHHSFVINDDISFGIYCMKICFQRIKQMKIEEKKMEKTLCLKKFKRWILKKTWK